MVKPATCSRTLQFRAGPNEYTFYACEDHRHVLVNGTVNDLFFATADEPVQEEDPEDEIECYVCRGEDGPDD